MSDKSIALRMAGSVRRRIFPEVDHLRAEVKRLRREVKKLKGRADPPARPAMAADIDDQAREIIELSRPYSMTSVPKKFALISAVRHLARTKLPGDFVECGVWRGGSVHCMARVLSAEGVADRDIHLFDTFEGMTEPTDKDVAFDDPRTAAERLATAEKTDNLWAMASLEDVQQGLRTLDYPYERFHFVQGPVEETVPEHAPEQIALLRLDTDWYESTKHELEHLYDRLVPGGVLIIDDYGSWQGSKIATDEFMATLEHPPLMLRAGTGRIGVKP